jgi:hypothetical protein
LINYLKFPNCLLGVGIKFLKLIDTGKKFQVSNGSIINLWLDSWHLDGILYDQYGYRVIHDAKSKIFDAKL